MWYICLQSVNLAYVKWPADALFPPWCNASKPSTKKVVNRTMHISAIYGLCQSDGKGLLFGQPCYLEPGLYLSVLAG
jgi:hypothetical protein